MKFTPEQEAKLINNLDMIISYIETNIKPNIPDEKMLRVEFGAYDNPDKKCVMNVWNDSDYDECVDGYVGYSAIHFEKDKKKHNSYCAYDYIDYVANIVINWSEIKEKLHSNLDNLIEERNRIIEAINTFTV